MALTTKTNVIISAEITERWVFNYTKLLVFSICALCTIIGASIAALYPGNGENLLAIIAVGSAVTWIATMVTKGNKATVKLLTNDVGEPSISISNQRGEVCIEWPFDFKAEIEHFNPMKSRRTMNYSDKFRLYIHKNNSIFAFVEDTPLLLMDDGTRIQKSMFWSDKIDKDTPLCQPMSFVYSYDSRATVFVSRKPSNGSFKEIYEKLNSLGESLDSRSFDDVWVE